MKFCCHLAESTSLNPTNCSPNPDAAIRDYLDQPVTDLQEGQAITATFTRQFQYRSAICLAPSRF